MPAGNCAKCIKDHSTHGQNFISLEDLVEQLQQNHQNSIYVQTMLDEKLKEKENTNILANFDEKTSAFAEKVEKQMQSFIEHIKSIKVKKDLRSQSKKMLANWVMDAGKAVGVLQRYIEELTEEMKRTEEAISKQKYLYLYERNLDYKALLDQSKLGIEGFENVEKGPNNF